MYADCDIDVPKAKLISNEHLLFLLFSFGQTEVRSDSMQSCIVTVTGYYYRERGREEGKGEREGEEEGWGKDKKETTHFVRFF